MSQNRARPATDLRAAMNLLGSAQVFASAAQDIMERRLLRQVAGSRLSFSQLRLLKMLGIAEAHTIGDVAAYLAISPAAASKAVDKLVKQRLVSRIEAASDRRWARVSLSEGGGRLLRRFEEARRRKIERIFAGYAPQQLRSTAKLLDGIAVAIVNHTAKAEEICLQCGIYFREDCVLRRMLGQKCVYQARHPRYALPS